MTILYFFVAGNPVKVRKWKNTDHAQHATKEILNDMPSKFFRVVQMLSDFYDYTQFIHKVNPTYLHVEMFRALNMQV
jgi:hypothetical protein